MHTKHTLAALAIALLGASAAFAADTPAQAAPAPQADSKKPVLLASASTTAGTATAAVTAVAAQPVGRTREEVRAEATEAVRNHRSTMSQQYDLLK